MVAARRTLLSVLSIRRVPVYTFNMRKLSTNITLEELERLEKAGELGYRAPEDDTILNIADAHVQKPSVSLSPDRSWLLLCDTPKFTPISHCKLLINVVIIHRSFDSLSGC